MAGARVEAVSAETEISRSVITDANGRYMILFPDGGGRYLLRVTFIGMGDVVQAVMREAEEELLLANITMQPQAIALDAINVQAQRPQPGDGRAGEQSTEMTQDAAEPAAAAGPGPEHGGTAGGRRGRHGARFGERARWASRWPA
jgi:hypothetical protein